MPATLLGRSLEVPHLAAEVEGALPACYCAGLIFSPSPARRRFGGCVRVGPQWILTAHHVLDIPDLASDFRCRFGYVSRDRAGIVDYELDAERGGFFASDDGIQGPSGWGFELDYVFIKLKGLPREADPSVLHPPVPHHGAPALHGAVRIPQHRNRGVMQLPEAISVSDPGAGTLVEVDDRYLYHKGSTEQGCSGSPILDDAWRLIGIHSHGDLAGSPDRLRRQFNRGTRIDCIIADARRRGFDLDQAAPYLESPGR